MSDHDTTLAQRAFVAGATAVLRRLYDAQMVSPDYDPQVVPLLRDWLMAQDPAALEDEVNALRRQNEQLRRQVDAWKGVADAGLNRVLTAWLNDQDVDFLLERLAAADENAAALRGAKAALAGGDVEAVRRRLRNLSGYTAETGNG